MEKTSIKFHGDIISELSAKIPSILVAFNELTKNSYDACSTMVNINMITSSFKIIVSDDGIGMSPPDIDTLFHISKSSKKYGAEHVCNLNENKVTRYNQGSKGLGFLSVFKFGHYVEWKSVSKNILRTFSADFNVLTKTQDLSNFPIKVTETDAESLVGTTIEIQSDKASFNEALSYLSNTEYINKIVNAFSDSSFLIRYSVDGKKVAETKKLNLNTNDLLFNVEYDSKDSLVKLKYNKQLLDTFSFNLNDTRYKLLLDLSIFDFTFNRRGKDNIDSMYKHGTKLVPLLYINNNYFNNTDLFDPEESRHSKNTFTMPQLTGFIKIYSDDELLGFNSDRTHFIENNLTMKIRDTLRDLNLKIQKFAAERKKYLNGLSILNNRSFNKVFDEITDEDIKANIKADFKYIDKVGYTKDAKNKVITYTFLGKEKKCSTIISKRAKTQSAFINLNKSSDRIPINSNQINLQDYISDAVNSKGDDIKKDIEFLVDGVKLDSSIFPSQSRKKDVKIIFEYDDDVTGLTRETLSLSFYEITSDITGKEKVRKLLTVPCKKDYSFDYNESLVNLVNQINDLTSNVGFEKYRELITSSLRSIFDISIDRIIKENKIQSYVTQRNNFITNISKVIQWAKTEKETLETNTGITKNDWSNLLIESDFETVARKTHLAAHKTSMYLSDEEIDFIAKKAVLFIVLTNEIINNF
jgi:hypothetical protein